MRNVTLFSSSTSRAVSWRQSGLWWVWVSIVVLLLDHVSKAAVLRTLTAYVPVSITGFFNVTLAYNKGAAFSFLDTASGWQTWFFGTVAVAVSVAILICLKKLTYQERWQGIALALIMGGALGNLWDRISLGYVIDFLDFHWLGLHWPAFNVADSAICIGAIMLFFDALAIRKK